MAANDSAPAPAQRRRVGADAGAGPADAELHVPCRVSERWLRFVRGPQFDALAQDDLLRLDVMTADRDGAPYKLCELTLGRADLLRAIAAAGEPAYHRAR